MRLLSELDRKRMLQVSLLRIEDRAMSRDQCTWKIDETRRYVGGFAVRPCCPGSVEVRLPAEKQVRGCTAQQSNAARALTVSQMRGVHPSKTKPVRED